ncbi:MAG: alpha/beta fold hydrolase [Luteolibacter sp.]|nr:alpha/beta fold hydrolase [Luteolibacter sp.]
MFPFRSFLDLLAGPSRRAAASLLFLLLAHCAQQGLPPEEGFHRAAVVSLKQAASKSLTAEQRAALYLDAAREAATLLDSPNSGEAAQTIYNQAAADLTVLLRSSNDGRMWNRPLALESGGKTFRLRFAPKSSDGNYDPNWFTTFTPASEVDMDSVKNRHRQDGIGGALVGVRKTTQLEPFAPRIGVTAPVTAVLDFNGREVTLSLVDPTLKTKARIAAKERVLHADFSAPLAHYPHDSELWNGLMGAIHADERMGTTGLYQLQPYDPDRIPLIFVHGLISTPRMWRNVINEIETDPILRRRYQCWVFSYPTGNPPAYSAMRLREELHKFRQRHPDSKDMVLVGHSMGGILTRMQVTDMDRDAWNVIGMDKASRFFKNVKPGDLIDRCAIYQANPHIDRAVFICTPHRGSKMAVGTLGALAIRLISLPVDIVSTATTTLGSSVSIITGNSDRMPTSIDGLSPSNPAFMLLDSQPMEVPYHSIIGDRGKGDTPNSSDGVVEYWSSHVKSAKSEKIVPGPHGACEMPETLDELRRILHLHLKSN